MRAPATLTALALLVLATGCAAPAPPAPEPLRRLDAEVRHLPVGAPGPAAAPGTCWGQETAPAVIETVTEHLVARPAEMGPEGQVIRPAIYRSVTRQQIVREREALWFRVLCPAELSPDLVATLQRALAARGLFQGQVTGTLDPATQRALRRFQAARGLESGQLSLGAARELGVAPYGTDG